jgi:hypothetical protein
MIQRMLPSQARPSYGGSFPAAMHRAKQGFRADVTRAEIAAPGNATLVVPLGLTGGIGG